MRTPKSSAVSVVVGMLVSGFSWAENSLEDALAAQEQVSGQLAGRQSESLGELPPTPSGFFEGSSLDLLERFYYRNLKDVSPGLIYAKRGVDGEPAYYTKSSAELGTLGSTLNFRSGYTPGAFGLGVDLSVMNGTTVFGGGGSASLSADMANTDRFGHPQDNWSKVAAADVRLKYSNTEFKYGRQIVDSPLLHSNYNRTFPASFVGASLMSTDLSGFILKAGYFTDVIGRNSTNAENLSLSYAPSVKIDRASYASIEYKGTVGLTVTGATAVLEDALRQYLVAAKYKVELGEGLAVSPQFAVYHNSPTGRKLAGDQEVSMVIGGVMTEFGANSLVLQYQQVLGDTFFDYLMETNSIYFSNTMYSDYQGPREKSFQAIYKHDFTSAGIPGLTLYAWALAGWDIDGSGYHGGVYEGMLSGVENARHYEVGMSPTYTFQAGALKGASLRVGYVVHKQAAGQIAGDADEFLLVGEFPFKIF